MSKPQLQKYKISDKKDNRIYVVVSQSIYRRNDIKAGAKIVFSYLNGLSIANKNQNKKAHVVIKSKTIAKQLNMNIRTVQQYIKELIDSKDLKLTIYGKSRALEPINLYYDSFSIITDETLKNDNLKPTHKLTHGIFVSKGLKTETHAFNFTDIETIATYMACSQATAYRHIKLLKSQSLISHYNNDKYFIQALDRYSREQHLIFDKQKYEASKVKEKIIKELENNESLKTDNYKDKELQAINRLFNRMGADSI